MDRVPSKRLNSGLYFLSERRDLNVIRLQCTQIHDANPLVVAANSNSVNRMIRVFNNGEKLTIYICTYNMARIPCHFKYNHLLVWIVWTYLQIKHSNWQCSQSSYCLDGFAIEFVCV